MHAFIVGDTKTLCQQNAKAWAHPRDGYLIASPAYTFIWELHDMMNANAAACFKCIVLLCREIKCTTPHSRIGVPMV